LRGPLNPQVWLRAIRAGFSQVGPVGSIALFLCVVSLVFVGCCLDWAETTDWNEGPRVEKPPGAPPVDRDIRVRLVGKGPHQSLDLAITCGYSIADISSEAELGRSPKPLSASVVRPAEGGIQIGTLVLPAKRILITPARDAGIGINGRTYRGTLQIENDGKGLVVINHIDVEAYLRGVLRGELPRYFQMESFKAQCVAARTYVLYQKQIAGRERTWDVTDDESSQVYVGVQGEDRIALAAARETQGEVCTWNDGTGDKLFSTYYSSACGGMSQHVHNVKPNDPYVPPLAGGVACNDCRIAKFYRWEPVKILKAELTRRLVARYPSLKALGGVKGLEPRARTPDGRIVKLELIGKDGDRDVLVGEDFRLSVGGRILKSTNFAIETRPREFIFKEGRGFGHGMGLCQFGMETKARQGMDYHKILAIYYPGAAVKKLY
jgi:stage II sporulation protein D